MWARCSMISGLIRRPADCQRFCNSLHSSPRACSLHTPPITTLFTFRASIVRWRRARSGLQHFRTLCNLRALRGQRCADYGRGLVDALAAARQLDRPLPRAQFSHSPPRSVAVPRRRWCGNPPALNSSDRPHPWFETPGLRKRHILGFFRRKSAAARRSARCDFFPSLWGKRC